MWIKSLDQDVWVNVNHITHFSIQQVPLPYETEKTYIAYAYLNAGESGIYFPKESPPQVQVHIPVCQGRREECVEFIDKQKFLEGLFQWVGYLVAGGIGAVLTLIF